jgi:hypothetical protein
MGNEHISFTTTKLGSLLDVEDSKDKDGLNIFYYLVQVTSARVSRGTRFLLREKMQSAHQHEGEKILR